MDLVKRKTIPDLYTLKLNLLDKIKQVQTIESETDKAFDDILSYKPYRIEYRFGVYGENQEEKYIDKCCWTYLIRIFELEKYMLCTDYEKLKKQIEDFNFPVFNIENAEGYINSLKDIIYDNVKTMLKQVYETIIESTYYTGSGYSNRGKKKRNNNGIDKMFILTTYDYSNIFGYYTRPTITDDLEKLCYILDNKKLPVDTIKNKMKGNGVSEYMNDYFKIKTCKNGNTHYWLTDAIRNKLNLYGADNSRIGENIRIKIFE